LPVLISENGAVTLPPRFAEIIGPGTPTHELAALLSARGHRCYLVGGPVRDVLLGREFDDFDITTDARPEAIKAAIGDWVDDLWLQGERYGTVGARKDGVTFEVTTFRADVYVPESRKPEVVFGDSIETDLGRRDFTVNAMALRLDADAPELVDPFDGLADLTARVLRTPQSTELSFGDDPLRMLRAARFAATLGFEPSDDVVRAMHDMRGRLEIISAERIRDELSKMLLADDPGPGLWLIARTHLSDEFLPELNQMELEQDPIHRHKDVLAHTIAVVQNTRASLVLRLAALLHDIGKPKTRGYSSSGVTFHYHDVVGARMARTRLTALRYPAQVVDDVVKLVELHLRFHTYRMGWTDSAVRRYVRDAGPLLDELNQLTRCDCTTRNKRKADALGRRMDELESRIEELQVEEDLAKIKPPLDGVQVMAYLGVAGGPIVGEALKQLLELRLDRGPMSPDDGYLALDEWARGRGLEPAGDRVDAAKPRD
jgi:poly(A) polymerase